MIPKSGYRFSENIMRHESVGEAHDIGDEDVGLLDVWRVPGALYDRHARARDHAAVGLP